MSVSLVDVEVVLVKIYLVSLRMYEIVILVTLRLDKPLISTNEDGRYCR